MRNLLSFPYDVSQISSVLFLNAFKFLLCLNWDPEDINVNSFLFVSRSLKIFSFFFFFQLIFLSVIEIGKFYCSILKFANSILCHCHSTEPIL